jgi:hypothetical protein
MDGVYEDVGDGVYEDVGDGVGKTVILEELLEYTHWLFTILPA